MITDFAVPAGTEPAIDGVDDGPSDGVRTADWKPTMLEAVGRRLDEHSGDALAALNGQRIYDAWCGAVDELLDSGSDTRRRLASQLPTATRLSPPALDAALEAMLSGFTGAPVRRLLEHGRELRRSAPVQPSRRLALAIVAGNIPGLAVQIVLPALAAGRPLLLKSASVEPFFAPALIRTLARREPRLADAVAAVTWPGGDESLERPLLDLADTLVAFGHAETLTDLRRRFDGRLVEMGPGLSLAIVGRNADPIETGRALAIDVALFEQRGCLSLQTIFTDGDASALAGGLRSGLEDLAQRWPPASLEPTLAAEIQQLRRTTELAGGESLDLPLRIGTVLVDPPLPAAQALPLDPLPGGRTVRIRTVDPLEELPDRLGAWSGFVQGAALAGETAWRLADRLATLGANRLVRPGELQYPDALWANGERHLLNVLLD